MLRKIVAALFLLLFLSFTGFLIYLGLKPEILPVGSAMPELYYVTETGREPLQPGGLYTMLIYFHTECEYCQYELNLFNESLHLFQDIRVILLTPEDDLFSEQKMNSWSALTNSAQVSWGIVDAEQFGEKFGNQSFPTTYIFDEQGVLRSKIYGEAKLDKLLSELEKSRWSGRQISGHN